MMMELALASNKPTLVVRLDANTRAALHEAALAVQASPAEWLGDAARQASFEPIPEQRLHADFVLCTAQLVQLPEPELNALCEALRKLVAAAAEEVAAPLPFSRFELYQPDKTFLAARFRVPEPLMRLRKAMWRECRAASVAFPDAMWMPHIKLGRLKAIGHSSLQRLDCSPLAVLAPQQLARPLGLTLIGERPPSAPYDWDEALLFAPSAPARPAMPWRLQSGSGAPRQGRPGGARPFAQQVPQAADDDSL